MKWQENPQLADELLGLIDQEMHIDKPLPHITELIYCLTKSFRERYTPIPRDSKTTCMFAIGVNLGDIMLGSLRKEVGGEVDGIYYSVDFLAPDGRMGELKSTRMGTKKPPMDFPGTWHKQLLSYMKVRETLEAVYAVMYVIPAEFKTWEVVALPEEVNTHWTWMLARRVEYMDFVERQEVPTPFKYNEDWECKNCQYRLECEADIAAFHVEGDLGEPKEPEEAKSIGGMSYERGREGEVAQLEDRQREEEAVQTGDRDEVAQSQDQ